MATIFNDSTVDESEHDGFFNNIKGKPNIAVVWIMMDGDVFGGVSSLSWNNKASCSSTKTRLPSRSSLKVGGRRRIGSS